jgi:hypothetical protein
MCVYIYNYLFIHDLGINILRPFLCIYLNISKIFMVMSRDRNAGRGHSVKIDNSFIERVEEFKYLGTMLTDKNSIQEEIMSRLKLGNACYHSVQNLLSSRLLSKNLKIKIYIEL